MGNKQEKPYNPSAFPREDYQGDYKEMGQSGMALRDYFANSVMQAYISTYSPSASCENVLDGAETISEMSYQIADAMLKQREL